MQQSSVLTVIFSLLCSLGSTPAEAQQTPLRLPERLAGTRASAVAVVQGNVLTAVNGPVAKGTVQLRNARTGRIIDLTSTDTLGLFQFRGVAPGSYVVELVDSARAILAASDILHVNGSETRSAVVWLPQRFPRLARIFGPSTASAATVLAVAAASGVLATQVRGNDVSPRR
jgi:hypothetical protein